MPEVYPEDVNRSRTDNTLTKGRTDNTLTKGRTDNTLTKGKRTNNGRQNTMQKIKD